LGGDDLAGDDGRPVAEEPPITGNSGPLALASGLAGVVAQTVGEPESLGHSAPFSVPVLVSSHTLPTAVVIRNVKAARRKKSPVIVGHFRRRLLAAEWRPDPRTGMSPSPRHPYTEGARPVTGQ
jgi:hypothetical protein